VVVDVANVMGARADGWWRDRAGAALRLGREVDALARRGGEATSDVREWVLVLEGKAREAAGALLADERDERDEQDEQDEGEPPLVRVVSAPASGDDAIVAVVAEFAARGETCLVVTADRELRRRCEELNASVAGPGWLLRLLQQVTLKEQSPPSPDRTMWSTCPTYRPKPDAHVRDFDRRRSPHPARRRAARRGRPRH
jgi:8-oxo-dGTP diphosphatase